MITFTEIFNMAILLQLSLTRNTSSQTGCKQANCLAVLYKPVYLKVKVTVDAPEMSIRIPYVTGYCAHA